MGGGGKAELRLQVRIAFGELLAEPLAHDLAEAMREGVDEFAREFGIPLASSIDLQPGSQLLQVSIGGRPLGYSVDLVRTLWGYVSGVLPDATLNLETVSNRLAEWIKGAKADALNAIRFCRLLCVEIVKQRPSVLVGNPQTQAFLDSALGGGRTVDGNLLAQITWALGRVVDFGVSLADRAAIGGLLPEELSWNAEDFAEEVISRFRPRTIEIRLNLAYLRELTASSDWASRRGHFKLFRDLMFEQTGVPLPPFRFVSDEMVMGRSCVFRLNSLDSSPYLGLGSSECLVVADEEGRLVLSQHDGSRLSLTTIDRAKAKKMAAWGGLNYLDSCLMDALAHRMHFFLDAGVVEKQLTQLNRQYPEIADAAAQRLDPREVLHTLRGLAAERVSIRDLRTVLERFLDRDYATTRSGRLAVLGELPDDLFTQPGPNLPPGTLEFVRRGLPRQISSLGSLGTSVIAGYTVDASVESLLDQMRASPINHASMAEQVRSAIRAQLAQLQVGAPFPALIVEGRVRMEMRNIVREEFPRLLVIAFEELSPDVNILPLATLGIAPPTAPGSVIQ